MRPHPADLATAATTIGWDLAADLLPEGKRRRWVRIGIAGAATATLAWLEREALAESFAELRSLRDLRQRIEAARTEEELDAIMAEVEDGSAPQPSAAAGAAGAATAATAATTAIVVGSLLAEVVLRRWTRNRIAAGARFPRLPAAVGRAGLAFVVGPATRALEQQPARR